MTDENALDMTSRIIGNTFDVDIVDGVMHIEPAEAGVQLFAYVKMTEDEFAKYEEQISKLADELLEKVDDNARLRDLVENLIPTLETLGYAELVDDILRVAYPVRGIAEDGERWKENDSATE